MTKENIKHAIIAIIVGAAVQVLVQLLQLALGIVSSWIPHAVSAAAGTGTYLSLWKTHQVG
jgi:hypothetical protein